MKYLFIINSLVSLCVCLPSFSIAQNFERDEFIYIESMECKAPEISASAVTFIGARRHWRVADCIDQDDNRYWVALSKINGAVGLGVDVCIGLSFLTFENLKLKKLSRSNRSEVHVGEDDESSGFTVGGANKFGAYVMFETAADENFETMYSVGGGVCIGFGINYAISLWNGRDDEGVRLIPSLYDIRVYPRD